LNRNLLSVNCVTENAGDTKDRTRTTRYVTFKAGGPITWYSRKQEIVALSTTEAEYIAAAECCKELKYLKTIIQELTNIKAEINMYVDNESAIKQIESGQVSRKNKHIDVYYYYYISEQLAKGLFCIQYCK
jgi:hypothetical protein